MSENVNKYKKYFIIIVPILLIAFIVELILLLKPNNELKSNQVKPNNNDDIKLGDSTILFDSANVNYNNANSGLTSTKVQDAIDELYDAANTCVTNLGTCNSNYSTCSSSLSTAQSNYSTCSSSLSTCQSNLANAPIAKNNTVYYAFGTPTTSSTTDYTTLNKKVFVALNGSQKSVCVIRNSKLHCFDTNNWPIEKDHAQQVFSNVNCYVNSSYVDCNASDFRCRVYSDGNVNCYDYSADELCYVLGGGSLECY